MTITVVKSGGIIKIGSGARVDIEAAAAPAPLELPFQPDAIYWYDFTDTSQLFQTTDESTPAVTNGDDIQRVNDKGSKILNVTGSGATAFSLNTVGESFSYAGSTNLNAASATVASTHSTSWTVFGVFRLDFSASTGMPFKIGTSATMEIRTTSTGIATRAFTGDGATVLQNATAETDGVWYAFLMMSRDGGTQELWTSVSATTDTDTFDFKELSSGLTLILGANTTGGGNDHTGDIAEMGVYGIDDGDEATLVADFQAYTTEKYGVTWA